NTEWMSGRLAKLSSATSTRNTMKPRRPHSRRLNMAQDTASNATDTTSINAVSDNACRPNHWNASGNGRPWSCMAPTMSRWPSARTSTSWTRLQRMASAAITIDSLAVTSTKVSAEERFAFAGGSSGAFTMSVWRKVRALSLDSLRFPSLDQRGACCRQRVACAERRQFHAVWRLQRDPRKLGDLGLHARGATGLHQKGLALHAA